jgi:Sulfotransferase domain
MLFPELHKGEKNSMKASASFFRGLFKRIFNSPKQKVFVIGFHKTGTSSLGKALQILGYKVCGSLKEGMDYEDSAIGFTEYLLRKGKPLLEKYDAFQDTPWFLLYEELYRTYPKAYFILTVRDPESWLHSVQNHFGTNEYPYHKWIYTSLDPFKSRELYLARFNDHNRTIRDFFKGKDNFMEFSIETDGWKQLAGHLGLKIPMTKFPYANKASHRNSFISKIKMKLKKGYYN